MSNLKRTLLEIEDRAARSISLTSDDFNHDVTKLLSEQVELLHEIAGSDVPKLLAVIKELIEQRDDVFHKAYHHPDLCGSNLVDINVYRERTEMKLVRILKGSNDDAV